MITPRLAKTRRKRDPESVRAPGIVPVLPTDKDLTEEEHEPTVVEVIFLAPGEPVTARTTAANTILKLMELDLFGVGHVAWHQLDKLSPVIVPGLHRWCW